MKTFCSVLKPALFALACASISACTSAPPRQSDMDYQTRPLPVAPRANSSGESDQRLIIQSGEGEKLNLPWFVRDTQNWINSN